MNNDLLEYLAKYLIGVRGNDCVNPIINETDSNVDLYGDLKDQPIGVDQTLELYLDPISYEKLLQIMNKLGVYDYGNSNDKGGSKPYSRYVAKDDSNNTLWIVPKNDDNGDANK